MNPAYLSLAPLLRLAGQLEEVAHALDEGVLRHQDPDAVAYARDALRIAAHELIHVLEHTV